MSNPKKPTLKELLKDWLQRIKVVKIWQEFKKEFNWVEAKSKLVEFNYNWTECIEFVKEKDYEIVKEWAEIFVEKKEYKGNPYCYFHWMDDMATPSNTPITSNTAPIAPNPIQYYNEPAPQENLLSDKERRRELSIVMQSISHIPWHFTMFHEKRPNWNWEDYLNFISEQAKALISHVNFSKLW